ncbi:hypothetical protein OUZ56_022361 [Daphnia magna]|uniref:Uncharacterized protein n=1 Tax=Daphnia magna TaxID=35525 RepID=A0ABR0AW54_9CRUS|nr:hypothetical protein OUZ56_022361 [Daphnia magna]
MESVMEADFRKALVITLKIGFVKSNVSTFKHVFQQSSLGLGSNKHAITALSPNLPMIFHRVKS